MTHLKLENQLCHRLYVASNAVVRAYRPLLDTLDVTYPQYVALMALWETRSADVGLLRNKTKIDGGALTLILQKLQKKGLIDITTDQRDRRSKIVSLTTAGADLEHKAQHIPQQLACMFPAVQPEQVDELKEMLDKLIGCLAGD